MKYRLYNNAYNFSLCAVYYLKASFGPSTADAVLEIPVSVIGTDAIFRFYYQISSPKIDLDLYVSRNGSITLLESRKYKDQYESGEWNELYVDVDSGVDAFVVHANKIGITTTTEFVLLDSVHIMPSYFIPEIGCISLLHRSFTVRKYRFAVALSS